MTQHMDGAKKKLTVISTGITTGNQYDVFSLEPNTNIKAIFNIKEWETIHNPIRILLWELFGQKSTR